MLWKSVFFLALAVAQVPAISATYLQVDDYEDVAPGPSIKSQLERRPGPTPYHAYLRITSAAGVISSCGGAVIHSNWVLTAAHCTAMQHAIIVRAGTGIEREAWLWYNYPTFAEQWVHVVQPHDIALVRLSWAFVFSDDLRPIQLESSNNAYREYWLQVMYTSGLGRSLYQGANGTVHREYFSGLFNSQCQDVLGVIGDTISRNSMCASLLNNTVQTTCYVDGGAPLVFEDRGRPLLVGVTSFVVGELVGAGGCHYGRAAAFTRTAPYHGWFTEITSVFFDDAGVTTTTESGTVTDWWFTSTTEEPTTATDFTYTMESTAGTDGWFTTTAQPTERSTTLSTISDSTINPPSTPAPTVTDSEPVPIVTEPTPPVTEPELTTEPDVEPEEDSESEEDPELSELLKRLEVKVKVKLSKYGSHKEIHHNKTVTHHRHH